jgi:putative toxin-antitoxin system antitoxin component (TIGR02293 family)
MADAQIAPVPVRSPGRDPVRGQGTGALSPDQEMRRVRRSGKRLKRTGSVQNLVAVTRDARRGMIKSEAAKLIGKIASATSMPLGRVRAELIPDSTWKRAGKTLGPQASQTIARLNHVFEFAQRIWGNERDAAGWLAAPHVELNGATPYSMLRTEAGGRVVESLLGAIEYGFPV